MVLLTGFVLGGGKVYAQNTELYYTEAIGKEGEELKSTLNDIITEGHKPISYGKAYSALTVLDQDPNNSSNVIGIYSGFSMDGAKQYDDTKGWSKEHVWADSRGDFGTKKGAGTDLHHLRAADASTNSARSNRFFGICNTYYVDTSGNYTGQTDSKTCSDRWVWEPRDEVKGDVARMLFYMATRYEGEGGEPDLELTDSILGRKSKEPLHGRLSLLLKWHVADPVSEQERKRNDLVYTYQGNRNPYIDHPEYVEHIWQAR